MLGEFKGRYQDVRFKIKASEQLSPEPPYVMFKGPGEIDYRDPVDPVSVVEITDTDGILYNEFEYVFPTIGEVLGTYYIQVGDTDLVGNPGSAEDTIKLRGSYGYWYNYDYNYGL